jgi:transglutaminase-like putative cysteine protease
MINPFLNFVRPGIYTDSDHPAVQAFAREHTQGLTTPIEQAKALYLAVRDGFRYDPYRILLRPHALKASYLLSKDHGYCVEKSNLLAASARALGIPTRLGYANVRNHLATGKIEAFLRTDVLVFHGYVELHLEGQWVKATPVFDQALCQRLGVAPLEFDGLHDSIFQQSDKQGNPFMEYLHDHGLYSDVPFEAFVEALKTHYPHLFERGSYRSEDDKIHWEV